MTQVTTFYLKMCTMGNTLVGWIEDKLQETGWSQRELARRAKVSHSMVSKVINREKSPGLDFCIAIANAFEERPENVMRLAGLLPPSAGKLDDLSEEEAELVKLYRLLADANDRETMFVVGQGLLMRQGQREGE